MKKAEDIIIINSIGIIILYSVLVLQLKFETVEDRNKYFTSGGSHKYLML